MIECILGRRDAERNVIEPGKCPRVTNPVRQKRDDRCRFARVRQRRAITEGNFHLGRRQRAGELFGDRAVRAISTDQVFGRELRVALRADGPAAVGALDSAPGYFFRKHIRAGFKRAFTQESIKRDA